MVTYHLFSDPFSNPLEKRRTQTVIDRDVGARPVKWTGLESEAKKLHLPNRLTRGTGGGRGRTNSRKTLRLVSSMNRGGT